MVKDNEPSSPSGPDDDRPPPLPPRPLRTVSGSVASDPKDLQAKPTTAVSSIDIQTLSFPDGSRGTFSTPTAQRAVSTPLPASSSGYATPSRDFASPGAGTGGELEDAMSVMSFAPTLKPPGDIASLLAGELHKRSPAWNLLRSQSASVPPFASIQVADAPSTASFEDEFIELPDDSDANFKDEDRLLLWRSKLKHYMILSSAGKPIYSRHGDPSLINSYMGVVQTIISFYEGARNPLLGFTAGDARFVIVTEGPLYLVAISRLGESDAQLRDQLKALYMQILSTLTLPTLTRIFANRPSTDLRKPLQGTEPLLSSLADNFTRGSPSALLGSLECLRLRKSQRYAVTREFLRLRTERLLYGLIVAGGQLVSVIRPRKHTLHPGDLQLIFNMLFASGSVRSDGGESWIPLCLPAFNNTAYLYMYVSFFDAAAGEAAAAAAERNKDNGGAGGEGEEEIAIILISPDKESFFELKKMRDNVAAQLTKNGSLALIRTAARQGRPVVADVAPGSQVSHFLYKSRAHVQFAASSLAAPALAAPLARRRLLTLYHRLHAAAHARHAQVRVLHCVGADASSLAWVTPAFEFYCVAGPNASRAAVTQGANKIIQWVKREEERLFIIGGGVF